MPRSIPGGYDLAPRRRSRRRWPYQALGVVLVLGAAGYGGWLALGQGSAPARVAAGTSPCPSPTVPSGAALAAAPRDVAVRVLNATQRAGLAHTVATELHRRGFGSAGVGNARPAPGSVATIGYPASAGPAARLLAEQVPGVTLRLEPSGPVQLILGPRFAALATPAQVAAAHRRDLALARPRPVGCTSR